MLKQLKNNNGLTLVEILAALVLLSIVLVTFMTFFTQSAKFTAHNHETLTAVQVAEDVVGQLRESDSSDLPEGGACTSEDYKYRNLDTAPCERITGYYKDHTVLLFEVDNPPQGLKKVKVIVKALEDRGINDPEFETEMYYEVD